MCSFGHAVTHASLFLSLCIHAFLPKSACCLLFMRSMTLCRLMASIVADKVHYATYMPFFSPPVSIHNHHIVLAIGSRRC